MCLWWTKSRSQQSRHMEQFQNKTGSKAKAWSSIDQTKKKIKNKASASCQLVSDCMTRCRQTHWASVSYQQILDRFHTVILSGMSVILTADCDPRDETYYCAGRSWAWPPSFWTFTHPLLWSALLNPETNNCRNSNKKSPNIQYNKS